MYRHEHCNQHNTLVKNLRHNTAVDIIILRYNNTWWPPKNAHFWTPYNFIKYWPIFKLFFIVRIRRKFRNNTITKDLTAWQFLPNIGQYCTTCFTNIGPIFMANFGPVLLASRGVSGACTATMCRWQAMETSWADDAQLSSDLSQWTGNIRHRAVGGPLESEKIGGERISARAMYNVHLYSLTVFSWSCILFYVCMLSFCVSYSLVAICCLWFVSAVTIGRWDYCKALIGIQQKMYVK